MRKVILRTLLLAITIATVFSHADGYAKMQVRMKAAKACSADIVGCHSAQQCKDADSACTRCVNGTCE